MVLPSLLHLLLFDCRVVFCMMLKIKRNCVKSMLAAARSAYPNEFIGILEGDRKGEEILVESMLVPPNINVGRRSASFSPWMLSSSISDIGTFHSHPHGSSRQSGQDRAMGSKEGGVHFVLGWPFELENLVAYDSSGNRVGFEIV
jgi:proteasome lid subunit RPN8/RPN11